MTELKIYSMYDYLTDTSVAWRKNDHKALKIVKSIKGKSFGGHLEIKIKGQTRRFFHPDCGDVVNYIARIMAAGIADLTEGRICLAPVPNSHVNSDVSEYKSLTFAQKVAENIPDRCSAAGVFCWKEPRNPQHKANGQRHMSQFVRNLELVRKPRHPVVLIDDMVTSGSQMLACKSILTAAGCDVLFGMSVGRAAESQTSKPIGWRNEVYRQDVTLR